MARDNATQQQIHDSIVARLIDKVTGFSSSTCFTSETQYPSKAPPNDIFCTVVPLDGSFGDGEFTGGGTDTLTEHTSVVVNVFSMLAGDDSGHIERSTFDPQRGLISYYKPTILRALLVDWEPNYSGNELLRNMLQPVRSTGPQEARFPNISKPYLMLALEFAIDFDWDLSV